MQQLKDLSRTTLSASINNSVTSLVVTDNTKVSSTGTFFILIDDELMRVTAVSGSTLTVVRGVGGTTAASHTSGAKLSQVQTVEQFRGVLAEYNKIDTFANRPAAGIEGRAFWPTDVPLRYIDNGTNWQPVMRDVLLPYGPIDQATFTQVNFSGCTATNRGDACRIDIDQSGGINWRFLAKNLISTTNYSVQVACLVAGKAARSSTLPMLGLRHAASGTFFTTAILESDTSWQIYGTYATSPNSDSIISVGKYINKSDMIVFKFTKSGTNIKMLYSFDGVDFYEAFSFTRSTYMANDPDQYIIGGFNSGGDFPARLLFAGLGEV